MSKNKKTVMIHYCVINFLFWFFYGDVTNYCSVYLVNCRFSGSMVGAVIAIGSILNVVLQPRIAAYADKNLSLSLKRIIAFMASVMFGISLILYFTHGSYVWISFALYTAMVLLIQLMQPYVNAMAFNTPDGTKLDYGFARGIGSGGYVIMSFMIGSLINRLTPDIQPLSIAAVLFVFIIVILLYPNVKRNLPAAATDEKTSDRSGSFLHRYKFFTVSLAGWMLILMGHTYLNSYLFQVISVKGGGTSEMGVAMAIAALVEIPIMLLFPLLLKKARVGIYYRISGVFFTIKIILSMIVPSVTLFYIIQLLQMLGWGLYSVSSVYFVDETIPAQDRIKGQSYMSMSYTLGMIAGSLSGGVLIDCAGVTAMLAFGSAVSVIGTVLVWKSERMTLIK